MVNMAVRDGSFGQRAPAPEAGATVGVGHPDAPWGIKKENAASGVNGPPPLEAEVKRAV
jgi:hypothetical protein